MPQSESKSFDCSNVAIASSDDVAISTDVEHVAASDSSVAESMDVDLDFSRMDLEPAGKVMAARTKPVQANKFKKRLGAKKAKRLELAENASGALGPEDATMYRALSARCNYLALDRPDLTYSVKEACREMAAPTKRSWNKLIRVGK